MYYIMGVFKIGGGGFNVRGRGYKSHPTPPLIQYVDCGILEYIGNLCFCGTFRKMIIDNPKP